MMIAQIFNAVEEHSVNRRLPQQLSRMFGTQPSNFVQAINMVRDYCSETN
jgi:hypothetical protein